MDRKSFIKKSTVALGTLSLMPLASSCQSTANEEKSTTVASAKIGKSASSKPKLVQQSEGIKLNVIGDNQLIKITGEDTNGAFTLIEQDNKPGVGIPMHVHQDEDEIFQMLEGKVEMQIGEEKTVLGSGDLIFCPRGVPHSWTVIGDTNARAILSIFPSGLENMFQELAKLPSGPPDLKKVAEICGKYNVSFV